MRERAQVVGGSLATGPDPSGAFRVLAAFHGGRRLSVRVLIVDDQELVRTGLE